MNMRKEGETKTGGKNGDGEVVLLFLGWEACYQPSCLHWPLLAIEGQTVSTSLPPFNCRVVPDSYMEPTWWTACPPHIHNNPSVCSFCFSCSREIFILGFCFSRFTFICIVSCVFFPLIIYIFCCCGWKIVFDVSGYQLLAVLFGWNVGRIWFVGGGWVCFGFHVPVGRVLWMPQWECCAVAWG